MLNDSFTEKQKANELSLSTVGSPTKQTSSLPRSADENQNGKRHLVSKCSIAKYCLAFGTSGYFLLVTDTEKTVSFFKPSGGCLRVSNRATQSDVS